MDYKEQEKNIFRWMFTSDSDLQYGLLESPHFRFYSSETCVCWKLKRTNKNEHVQFSFRSLIPNGRRVFHRTSLVDNKGKEYFTSSGQLFSHTDNILMIISFQDYFLPQIQNGLMLQFTWFEDEECCVSLRNLHLTESSNSSELAIQHDISLSPPIKDGSSSTESSDNDYEFAIQRGITQSASKKDSSTSTEILHCFADRAIQADVIQPLPTTDDSTIAGSCIQISECSTQTDVIQPLSTRDSLTDTENSFQICNRGIQTEIIQSSRDSSTITENYTIVHECGSQTEGIESLPSNDISTNTENETYQFLDTLSKDFGSFFENKTNSDCVLIVDETKFPAHRSVLSARSTVFAAMFHHDTSESQNGKVVIQDVDSDAFGEVLHFIYTGKVRGLSSDSAAPMYTVADKYALIQLRDKCLDYLLCNLTVDNVCDAALLADVHAESELENKVVQFLKERLRELMGSTKWKHFTDIHSKIANKLLSYALIAC